MKINVNWLNIISICCFKVVVCLFFPVAQLKQINMLHTISAGITEPYCVSAQPHCQEASKDTDDPDPRRKGAHSHGDNYWLILPIQYWNNTKQLCIYVRKELIVIITTHFNLSSDTTAPHCYWVNGAVETFGRSPKIRDIAKFLDNKVWRSMRYERQSWMRQRQERTLANETLAIA